MARGVGLVGSGVAAVVLCGLAPSGCTGRDADAVMVRQTRLAEEAVRYEAWRVAMEEEVGVPLEDPMFALIHRSMRATGGLNMWVSSQEWWIMPLAVRREWEADAASDFWGSGLFDHGRVVEVASAVDEGRWVNAFPVLLPEERVEVRGSLLLQAGGAGGGGVYRFSDGSTVRVSSHGARVEAGVSGWLRLGGPEEREHGRVAARVEEGEIAFAAFGGDIGLSLHIDGEHAGSGASLRRRGGGHAGVLRLVGRLSGGSGFVTGAPYESVVVRLPVEFEAGWARARMRTPGRIGVSGDWLAPVLDVATMGYEPGDVGHPNLRADRDGNGVPDEGDRLARWQREILSRPEWRIGG